LKPGKGTLSLLIVAAIFAALVGAYVWSRPGLEPFLRTGESVPGFKLPSQSGGPDVSLESLRGKVAFVNFWATWCAPCREEAPALQRLYQELQPEGFEIVAISIDKPETAGDIEAFRRDFSLTFPILLDPTSRTYHEYLTWGVPETFLIDGQGKLIEHFVGPKNWADPRYSRAIRRALAAAKESGGSPGE